MEQSREHSRTVYAGIALGAGILSMMALATTANTAFFNHQLNQYTETETSLDSEQPTSAGAAEFDSIDYDNTRTLTIEGLITASLAIIAGSSTVLYIRSKP
jgi:hypothetical protein